MSVRISDLVEASAVPLPTIKFYLREGLLMPGEATAATQALYGEAHLKRLRLIRALRESAGLSIKDIAAVITLIEAPSGDLYHALGTTLSKLPPEAADGGESYPRAQAALEKLGQIFDPTYAAVAQLERALKAAEEVGMPLSDDRLRTYGRHLMSIAEADIDNMPQAPSDALEYAVLGTILYEPVIAALRRLAHQHLAHENTRTTT